MVETMLPRLRDLARQLAPELDRLYVLTPPPGYPWAATCEGLAVLHCDYTIRQTLIDRGEWQGPAPMILLAADLGEDRAERSGLFSRERHILTVFVHELAHCLPALPAVADCDPSPAAASHELSLLQLAATTPNDIELDRSQHGPGFIRRALHLWFRAQVAGVSSLLSDTLCGGIFRWQSQPHHFLAALGDEPLRCHRKAFAEIESEPPPDLFTQICAEDDEAFAAALIRNNERKST